MTENVLDRQTMTPSSPGVILQTAREAKGLSQDEIAAKLHLRVQNIKDMEADNYDHFAAPIYVRGYLRSYTRLLEIPEEHILKLFDTARLPVGNGNEKLISSGTTNRNLPIYSQSAGVHRHVARWVGVIFFIILILLVILWWRGQALHLHSPPVPQQVSTQSAGLTQIQAVPLNVPQQIPPPPTATTNGTVPSTTLGNRASTPVPASSATPGKPGANPTRWQTP